MYTVADMAEFQFKDGTAELKFGETRFRLPVTETQLSELMAQAQTLRECAGEAAGDIGELTELVLTVIDDILGPGAADAILAGRDYCFFDAMDVFRYIYSEFFRMWRERVIELGGRAAVSR